MTLDESGGLESIWRLWHDCADIFCKESAFLDCLFQTFFALLLSSLCLVALFAVSKFFLVFSFVQETKFFVVFKFVIPHHLHLFSLEI